MRHRLLAVAFVTGLLTVGALGNAEASEKTIIETTREAGDFTTFLKAVDAAD